MVQCVPADQEPVSPSLAVPLTAAVVSCLELRQFPVPLLPYQAAVLTAAAAVVETAAAVVETAAAAVLTAAVVSCLELRQFPVPLLPYQAAVLTAAVGTAAAAAVAAVVETVAAAVARLQAGSYQVWTFPVVYLQVAAAHGPCPAALDSAVVWTPSNDLLCAQRIVTEIHQAGGLHDRETSAVVRPVVFQS